MLYNISIFLAFILRKEVYMADYLKHFLNAQLIIFIIVWQTTFPDSPTDTHTSCHSHKSQYPVLQPSFYCCFHIVVISFGLQDVTLMLDTEKYWLKCNTFKTGYDVGKAMKEHILKEIHTVFLWYTGLCLQRNYICRAHALYNDALSIMKTWWVTS